MEEDYEAESAGETEHEQEGESDQEEGTEEEESKSVGAEESKNEDEKVHKELPKKKEEDEGEDFDALEYEDDLSTESRSVVKHGVKISQSLQVCSGTIHGMDIKRQSYEYPGVFFIKKMKNNKCFRYNFPLKDAGKVVYALTRICEVNQIEIPQ